MAEDDIIVRITGDISGLKEGLNEAKKSTKQATEEMSESLKELKKEFLAAFAFEKIKEFVTEAINEFAQFERAMNTLGAQVKAQGQNWAEMKESVEAFLKTQSTLYGQTDEQLLPVMQKLYAVTHNMGTATKIMDDANKLALLGFGEMASNADVLAAAFTGSGKGVAGLAKLLKISKDRSTDATFVFGELSKQMKIVGDVSEDTQSKVNAMSVDWREDMQHIGEVLSPILVLLHGLEKVVINLVDLIIGFGKIIDDVLLGVGKTIFDTGQLLVDIWKNPKKAFSDFTQNMKDNYKNFNAEVIADTDKTNQDIYNTWVKTTEKVKVQSDKQFADEAANNDRKKKLREKDAEDRKKALEESQKLIDDLSKSASQHETERLKSTQAVFDETLRKKERGVADMFNKLSSIEFTYDKKRYDNAKKNLADEENLRKQARTKEAKAVLDARLKEDKAYKDSIDKKIKLNEEATKDAIASAEQIQKYSTAAAERIGQGFDNMFKMLEEGTLTMTKAFEEMGKAVGAALLQPLIDYLNQQGAAAIAKGTAEMIAGLYPAGAADLAAGSLYIAGGSAVKAASSYYLEEGGIVAGGSNTHFVAGDGPNPEAVIPLDKHSLSKLGLGGNATIQNMHLHLPEVKNTQDLTNPRTLARITTTMNRRIGNRQKGL